MITGRKNVFVNKFCRQEDIEGEKSTKSNSSKEFENMNLRFCINHNYYRNIPLAIG